MGSGNEAGGQAFFRNGGPLPRHPQLRAHRQPDLARGQGLFAEGAHVRATAFHHQVGGGVFVVGEWRGGARAQDQR